MKDMPPGNVTFAPAFAEDILIEDTHGCMISVPHNATNRVRIVRAVGATIRIEPAPTARTE